MMHMLLNLLFDRKFLLITVVAHLLSYTLVETRVVSVANELLKGTTFGCEMRELVHDIEGLLFANELLFKLFALEA